MRKAKPSLGSSEPGEKDAHSRMIQPGSSGDFQEGFLEEVPADLSLMDEPRVSRPEAGTQDAGQREPRTRAPVHLCFEGQRAESPWRFLCL